MVTENLTEYDLFNRDGMEKVLLAGRVNPEIMIHLPANRVNIERPEGLTTQFDQSLKFTLKMVSWGYSLVYPNVFGNK